MPFFEEVGINLEGAEPISLKLNWKTGAVIKYRELGPNSSRTANHKATESTFLGDAARRPYSHAASLEAILGSTAKWNQALPNKTVNPDLVNFSRSGVRHIKASRRFKPPLEPKEVVVNKDADSPTQKPASPIRSQANRSSSPTATSPGKSKLADILRRLNSGDGVPDMIAATSQLLQLVQGEGDNANDVRAELERYAGILRGLVKLLKLCQPPHQIHKPMVMKTLSQAAFYSKVNSELLAGEAVLLEQIVLAVFSGIENLQNETARLINNLTASSVHAAEKVCQHEGMLDAIKRLCSHQRFFVRLRAVSAVNCLTRHSLSFPKLKALLAQFGIVDGLTDSESSNAISEEQRLYGFMVTCAVGNSISTIERRTWSAPELHLKTAVDVFRAARTGCKFAGVSCQVLSIFLSLRYLSVSEANKKALFNHGLVEELADYVETWVEDTTKDLSLQLECFEHALNLLLILISVDGKTVLKAKLFQTEVKACLRALDFGASLFRAIKTRPSHTAVDLSRRLIAELQLRLDDDVQGAFGFSLDDSPPRRRTECFTSTRLRMLGTSNSIPRSSDPSWAHPLTTNAGGGPPSIPRPHTTSGSQVTRVGNGKECEILFPWEQDVAERPLGLAWNFPSKRALTMLFRKQLLRNWRCVLADLRALRRCGVVGGDADGAACGVAATDVYKLLGGHRIWYEAREWHDFVRTFLIPKSSESCPENLIDLDPLLHALQTLCSGGRIHVPGHSEICVLAEGGESPLRPQSGGRVKFGIDGGVQQTGEVNAPALAVAMMSKQVQTDLQMVNETLASSPAVNVFKLHALLRSIGWVLSKSELERICQTFVSTDAKPGLVSCADFVQLLTDVALPPDGEGTSGLLEWVHQIVLTERQLMETGEAVGSFHDSLAIERPKHAWKKTLQREHVRASTQTEKPSARALEGRLLSRSSTSWGGARGHSSMQSQLEGSMPRASTIATPVGSRGGGGGRWANENTSTRQAGTGAKGQPEVRYSRLGPRASSACAYLVTVSDAHAGPDFAREEQHPLGEPSGFITPTPG